MSKRAEQKALEAYPEKEVRIYAHGFIKYDANKEAREGFRKGYEQAEKDIIDLIESRIGEILGDAQPTPILRYELQDLIKKIKEKE